MAELHSEFHREEQWLNIMCDDQEISLSIENWEELKRKVDESIYVENPKELEKTDMSSIMHDFKRHEYYYWSAVTTYNVSEALRQFRLLIKQAVKLNYKLLKGQRK